MRLARSPYDALDIPAGSPTTEQIRTAFIRLSKIFHPHKFAQMSPDIQKQATEVFLSLRQAYDTLSKPKPAQRPSGMMPALNPRDGRPPPPSSSALNPPTQRGVPPAPTQREAGAAASSSQQIPAQRPVTTPATASQSQAMRAMTPPGGVPVVKRTMTPPGGVPAVAKAPTPPKGTPTTTTAANNATPSTPAPPPPTENPELGPVYEAFHKGNWDGARAALKSLLALKPSPRYEALIHYANAREAMAEGRVNDARVDLNAALKADSQLPIIKTAFQEMMARRK